MVSQNNQERQIEISARPIRYAYILGAKPSRKIILKIISDCCESFGGTHNIIIPSSGEIIEDCWLPFLVACDPDIILLCGSFNNIKAFKSRLSELDIQPFKIKKFQQEHGRVGGVVSYSPLPIDKIYRAKATESSNLGSGRKYNVVTASRRGKNTNLIDYFDFGILSESFISEFKQLLEFTSINKIHEQQDFTLVIDPTEACLENITHAEWEYFDAVYNDNILGPYVVVTGDPNSLEDCCLFWNWRALACRQFYVIWRASDKLNEIYDGSVFNQTILNFPSHSKLMTSYSFGKSDSSTFSQILSSIPNYPIKVSNFGFSYLHPSEYDKPLPTAGYFCARNSISLSGTHPCTINRLITPPYDYQDCIFKDLVFDLVIKSRTQGDKSGISVSSRHFVHDVLQIDQELQEAQARINRSYFTLLLPCSISTGSVSIKFKSDWEIISNYCKRKGVNIVESPSGKHIRRAIGLSGSIEELSGYYSNNIAREMLDAFKTRHTTKVSLKGRNREIYRRSFSVSDLNNTVLSKFANVSLYQKRKVQNEIYRLIDLWWRKGILVSGFNLKCNECNFESWYSIDTVGDRYVCLRCQLENKMPYDSQIHYRLQESFYQAHQENMLVPVLTLNYIKGITDESFLYSVPVFTEPNNPNSPEVDIITIVDGELIIGECKKTNKLDKAVFSRYGEVAKKIMAHRIIFSTINRENTCENQDCKECIKLGEYCSDEIFTHGIPSNPEQWGTREFIKDFRTQIAKEGISVSTICASDLGLS